MVTALRVVASVLAAVWAVLFFGIIDLTILFMWNEWFVEVAPLEVSWGALMTFFMAVPLVVVAVRPSLLWSGVVMNLIAAISLSLSATFTAYPAVLWLAFAALATSGIIAGIGLWGARRGAIDMVVPRFGVHWLLLILAVLGVPLWVPYIAHAAQALGVRPSDITLVWDHWPVQAAAGIAVLIGAFAAALLPHTRGLAVVAVSFCAAAIGVSAASHFALAVATETTLWGILCVLWGTSVALSGARGKGRPEATLSRSIED
jgi:hypothetical protein